MKGKVEKIMEIHIRNAKSDDYTAAEAIMKQVQKMHINWRPDIYKYSETLLPLEIYEQAVRDETFFVAEYEGTIAGILFLIYHHIDIDSQEIISRYYTKIADYHHYIQRKKSR